jgi:ElaB/YqjD/DUF883 family membrane-anchored ribosome-binding protein
MPGSAAATSEVERLIESRLEEIEEQLKPFTELARERSRLQNALGALRDGVEPEPARHASRPKRGRARSEKRAPRGSNIAAITKYVGEHPGSTVGEIAAATGITRGVVYSATSRLSSAGRLKRRPKRDGQVGFEIA